MASGELAALLEQEIALVEKILECQASVYSTVKEKNWVNLERDIDCLNELSSQFSAMEAKRDSLIAKHGEDSRELLAKLRSRLLKSKVQNFALNTYIETMQNFVRGVLENAVPQRRNVLYSREGKILKPEPQSVVLNKIL
ncbi:MAG: hypothetical protein K2N58_11490 [Treponemataceae bacterium]|nr:hypothetical protein [Treponemataceae bacterium]